MPKNHPIEYKKAMQDTGDYLGDSDELDEFAVPHTSDCNEEALTDKE